VDIFASVLACCSVSQMTVLLMNPKVPYRAFEGDSTNVLALFRTPLGMPAWPRDPQAYRAKSYPALEALSLLIRSLEVLQERRPILQRPSNAAVGARGLFHKCSTLSRLLNPSLPEIHCRNIPGAGMSGIGIVQLLPPAWDLKLQRQRDCDRTRKGLVRGAAKASAGTAEAKLVCGGKEWEAVQRALEGNPDALATLFAPDQARLYRSAFSLLRNKEDAQDALQDALLSAYLKLRSFEGRSRFSTWLTRIVLNAALINRRKLHSHPHVSLDEIVHAEPKIPDATMIDAHPNPEQAFRQMENRSTVVGAIHWLSSSLRSALHLRYLQGFSIKEAAELEGVSTGVMKSRSLRARRQLANRLDVRSLNLQPRGAVDLADRSELRANGYISVRKEQCHDRLGSEEEC